MSEEATEVRVNFGRPMPLFPLPTVQLMPQDVRAIHIFEPRYRQMVAEALDGPGQIAMAVFQGEGWRQEYHGRPPIRPAVCIGQIAQHQALPEGRFNIVLQGVCRARVLQELPPDSERLYRLAVLEPVGLSHGEEEELEETRARLIALLDREPLRSLKAAEDIVKLLEREDPVPVSAILELVTVALLRDSDGRFYNELHYRLLAEGDLQARVRMIETELGDLESLLKRAQPQRLQERPKWLNWN